MNLKRIGKVLSAAVLTIMLSACALTSPETGIDKNTTSGRAQIEVNSSENETDTNKADENKETEVNEKKIPTNDELCEAYEKYLTDITRNNENIGDLCFSCVDVNNDGIRELIYAEGGVAVCGVYVCYWNEDGLVTVGPFGSYGNLKYAYETGQMISVNDNYDYMSFDLIEIDENYEANTVKSLSFEPDYEEEDSYVFYADGESVSYDDFLEEFKTFKKLKTRSVEYNDMYYYIWINDDFDPLHERLLIMLTEDEDGRECNMIVPMEEKEKMVGTWVLYSSEFDGDIYYYDEDSEFKEYIEIDEDYNVTISDGYGNILEFQMYFVNGYYWGADNSDWYVYLVGDIGENDEYYMNVTYDGQLWMNYINVDNSEYLISTWEYFNRVSR